MLGAHAKVRQPEPAPRLPHVARLSPSHAPEFSLGLLFLIPSAKIARAKPPHPPLRWGGSCCTLEKRACICKILAGVTRDLSRLFSWGSREKSRVGS